MHSCSSASGYERASTPCATLSRCEPSEDLTRLERWIAPRVAANGGDQSAFRLLPTGLEAFVARAVLIELAERTLDLQYYIFHPDQTGSLIIDRLIAAADRGVRVRVLLDDWGTLEKKDELVAGLDAHQNIEIRVFNPYVHRSGLHRLGELLTSFTRVNRRMHNKQFIADGVATILGGRNIGDEYFSLGELDFQDVDVLKVKLAEAEVHVADVAAAQNRGDAVGDELLVVHAAIHAREAGEQLAEAVESGAVDVGIEDPDLDVLMSVEARDQLVLLLEGAPVIEQHAHPHAAIGGVDEAVDDQRAGLIGVEDVVL